MTRHPARRALALTFAVVSAATLAATPALAKWPPWLSIESPVNPYDATARGAIMLVHVAFREGQAPKSELSGTAEGIVDGIRRSIPLRFDETGRPSVFALRRQWPVHGAWLIRLSTRGTTAIVTLDQAGAVASVRVPTERQGSDELPRPVASREIDSALAVVARR